MSMDLTLFLLFFKIGITSFGGGYGMMSMIMDEGRRVVGLTSAEFADMTALDFITSGPIALNASTYVGYTKGGFTGAIFATLGCILPSIIVCTIVLLFLRNFGESTVIKGLFVGIKPACGGLLLYTGINLCKTVYFSSDTWTQVFSSVPDHMMLLTLLAGAISMVMDLKFKVNPIIITAFGAIFGLLLLT